MTNEKVDRNIPFYNVILKCDNYKNSEIILKLGYRFKNYELGREVNIESDLIARYLDRIVNFKDKDSLCQRMPYIY